MSISTEMIDIIFCHMTAAVDSETHIINFRTLNGCFTQFSDILEKRHHIIVGHPGRLLQLDCEGGQAAEHGKPLDLSDELLPGEHEDLRAHVGHGVAEGVIVTPMNHIHDVGPHFHARPHQDEVEAVQDQASKIALVKVSEQGI